jgi:hypothetical protein
MLQPHGLTKLIIDEQLDQLRMKSILANKLKKSENLSERKGRISFFEFITDIKIPSLLARLLVVSNSSASIECEIQECQLQSECQSC